MSRLTRRQFLGTSAAAAATLGTPHVWARPAWAQSKELRILAWSHFVPSYDKWIDQFIADWGAKNGVKAVIDHIPHLNLASKIAAEIATQSGHDIVQLAGSGTEKFAPALVDLQEVQAKVPAGSLGGLFSFLSGKVPLEARGRVSAPAEGFSSIAIEQVYLSTIPVPVSVVEQLVASATKTAESPQGFDVQSPFRLPYALKRVRLQSGRAVLEY